MSQEDSRNMPSYDETELDVLLKVLESFNYERERHKHGFFNPGITPWIVEPSCPPSETDVLDLLSILYSLCSNSKFAAVTFKSFEDDTLFVATSRPLNADQQRRLENMILSYKDFALHLSTSPEDVLLEPERRRLFLMNVLDCPDLCGMRRLTNQNTSWSINISVIMETIRNDVSACRARGIVTYDPRDALASAMNELKTVAEALLLGGTSPQTLSENVDSFYEQSLRAFNGLRNLTKNEELMRRTDYILSRDGRSLSNLEDVLVLPITVVQLERWAHQYQKKHPYLERLSHVEYISTGVTEVENNVSISQEKLIDLLDRKPFPEGLRKRLRGDLDYVNSFLGPSPIHPIVEVIQRILFTLPNPKAYDIHVGVSVMVCYACELFVGAVNSTMSGRGYIIHTRFDNSQLKGLPQRTVNWEQHPGIDKQVYIAMKKEVLVDIWKFYDPDNTGANA